MRKMSSSLRLHISSSIKQSSSGSANDGKMRRFEILFNNPEQAYFAGQEVTGRILIETSEPRRVTDILFELKGRARTSWTLESGKATKHCMGSEPYFCEQFATGYTKRFPPLAADVATTGESGATGGGAPTTRGRQLPAGVHEIPFSYTLPKSLPSSFEGDYGHVRYTCKATFQRPWDVDIVCRRAFTVIGIEDINDQADLLAPCSATASESQSRKCFCFRRQGSLEIELGVSRSGYTPGDAILASSRITHHNLQPRRNSLRSSTSSTTPRSIPTTLRLIQHAVYKAKTFAGQEHTRRTEKVAVKMEKGMSGGGTTQWDVERLIIPSLPPRLSKCGIIDVAYSLELEANSKTKCSLPITIGTIPLLSDIVAKAVEESNRAAKLQQQKVANLADQQQTEGNEEPPAPSSTLISPTTTTSGEDAVVQVTITDESGRTGGVADSPSADHQPAAELDESLAMVLSAKKRVRMPSSILSELYPSLQSPYYRESFHGRVNIAEGPCDYGETLFAPKYPFYND